MLLLKMLLDAYIFILKVLHSLTFTSFWKCIIMFSLQMNIGSNLLCNDYILLYLQFHMQQVVVLLNLKNAWQKVIVGTISNLCDWDKFHCMPIEELWFRVDVQVYISNHPFMHPNEIVDQLLLGDVVGTSALWHQKYLKAQ